MSQLEALCAQLTALGRDISSRAQELDAIARSLDTAGASAGSLARSNRGAGGPGLEHCAASMARAARACRTAASGLAGAGRESASYVERTVGGSTAGAGHRPADPSVGALRGLESVGARREVGEADRIELEALRSCDAAVQRAAKEDPVTFWARTSKAAGPFLVIAQIVSALSATGVPATASQYLLDRGLSDPTALTIARQLAGDASPDGRQAKLHEQWAEQQTEQAGGRTSRSQAPPARSARRDDRPRA